VFFDLFGTSLLLQRQDEAGHVALCMTKQVLAALHFSKSADGAVLTERQVVVNYYRAVLKLYKALEQLLRGNANGN
jgi:hypothetical protein